MNISYKELLDRHDKKKTPFSYLRQGFPVMLLDYIVVIFLFEQRMGPEGLTELH
jgi:hypothetical protein